MPRAASTGSPSIDNAFAPTLGAAPEASGAAVVVAAVTPVLVTDGMVSGPVSVEKPTSPEVVGTPVVASVLEPVCVAFA